MANRKISDLTALTAPATGDLLPIVDISEAAAADKNKKITIGELFASIPAGTAAAPSVAFDGYSSTGVYSSGPAQVAISTNGTQRVLVDSAGAVTIPTRFIVGTANNVGGLSETTLTTAGVFNTSRLIDGGTNPYLQTGAEAGIVYFNADGSSVPATVFRFGGTERLRIDSSGRLLVGGSADSGGALLQVFGDRIRISTAKTPASATATGTTGEIAWDANYIYVCTATNTWKRTAISTW
jgi:hypothetical protein